MLINDHETSFNAEYTGQNPLASLIDACAEFLDGDTDCTVKWFCHDNELEIEMELEDDNMLRLDITDKTEDLLADEKKTIVNQEWHETIPFEDFIYSIVNESCRVLSAFGICGYYRSWQNHEDFPLANLLRITGKIEELWKGDSCTSNIFKEINCTRELVKKWGVTTKERELDWCTIYYESWQLQCCGDPFSVGDKIEWTCIMPTGYKNAHGIVLDFEEEHHGFATHSITGTVAKILVERSEFPKGKKEAWYDRAETIQEEIRSANGRESLRKDDETTEYTLWGYIVELKDVLVKPLTELAINNRSAQRKTSSTFEW